MTCSAPYNLVCNLLWIVSCFVFCVPASSQQMYVDLEDQVTGLPSLVANSNGAANVLPISLATILHDPSICCGKDSALVGGFSC
jgi:hypothetical protein